MEFHPIASLFPMMADEEFSALVADIGANGQREPIWVSDGLIIDGRNRYLACQKANVEPQYLYWSGEGSLVAFVVSLNLHRRHLSASQRGCVAVDMLPWLEEEAKARQLATLKQNREVEQEDRFWEEPSTVSEIIHTREGRATEQAAVATNTNYHYVSDAKRIATEAPEVFQRVKRGELTIPQAKREIAKRDFVAPPPIEGKYRIFYADPPWSYGNSGVIGATDNYGRAERHYPSMSIEELCDMGAQVRESSEGDAVLFLWVTSPLLEDSFRVIRAWGFNYKTSFVWDKVRHNFGHYNSVRHELLLICTKGACTPDAPELIDSVQTIERSDIHSQKPDEFRAIIDTLYTHGNRIELFARCAAEGWDAWGNQALTPLTTPVS